MKKSLLIYAVLVLLLSCKSYQDPRPNIIVFFTDDQGYADLSCYGAEEFATPNIDDLASEGIRFTDFYVPATVCTPSRAGLLTGRYPVRAGLHEAVIFPYSSHGLKAEEYTIAEMLRDVAYKTGIIGKWHLGHEKDEYHPNNQGFDYYYGVPYSNDMDSYYYKHNDFQSPPLALYRNHDLIEEAPDQKYLTKMFTEEAKAFIKREKSSPFFLYIPHSMPHRPLHISEDFDGKSELGLYGDVIMELDWSVGEIVKTLKEEGLYKNTIVIFTSDNGPDLGSALPLRGKKASTWEGGQRVPGIISWPSAIKGGTNCPGFVSTLDLFPTLASLAGAELPENKILDGINISDYLLYPDSIQLPERPFYYYGRDGELEAIRLGEWKLHISKRRIDNFEPALYNLHDDISEQYNLAADNPDIVSRLKVLIDEFEHSLEFPRVDIKEGSYAKDKKFLADNNISCIELKNDNSESALLVIPEWQGRVMTSSSSGDSGLSYGWINYDFISKGEKSNQFNVYGGEERFWLGPEGGDYSLYFDEGKEQVFENWKVPAFIDTDKYPVLKQTKGEVVFEKSTSLINASGSTFHLMIKRRVKLLDEEAIVSSLGLESIYGLECVGYLTENMLSNIGKEAWVKEKGLISVWLLCMFAPSPTTTVFIPYKDSGELEGIPVVNDEYFGKVPEDRLITKDGVIYFKIDGKYRSKIGVPKGRAGNICGSYDSSGGVLTILKINSPENDSPYVNSNWGEQDDPFNGDVINSYNDGPVEDGSIMGPFYEIESSSPGAELSPGERIVHKQHIYHFKGAEAELEPIVNLLFGLSLAEIKEVF